jgi:hypothetical protein
MKILNIKSVNTEELSARGRLQYFYHCPSSVLPIRDVLNEQGTGFKTEPHIEVGGENILKSCFQPSIVSHVNCDERYLFLMTTCRNSELPQFYGIKSIVGYIDKRRFGESVRDGKHASFVSGETHIFPFEHSIPITFLGYNRWTRVKLVNEADTAKILNRFAGLDNLLAECINEIKRLDPEGRTCVKNRDVSCYFRTACKRY